MRFTSMTDKGGKEINQDSFASMCRNGIYCFVMADGEGFDGEHASNIVTEAVIDAFEISPSVTKEGMQKYTTAAWSAIKNASDSDEIYSEAKASAAILITDGKTSLTAHIGDTRIYTFTSGMIKTITSDHTNLMEMYVNGKIGFSKIRKFDAKFTRILPSSPEFEIDESVKLHRGTAFLMCTAGFWKNIDETNMEQAMKGTKSSKEWLGNMLRTMEKALMSDCDNITAVAIMM